MIDTHELDEWARVLAGVGEATTEKGKRLLSRGALNIKKDARTNAPKGRWTPTYYLSITYDVTSGTGWSEAEIGPRHDGPQWGLGNILEYGTPNTPPQPHLEPALDTEAPRYLAAAEDLVAGLMDRQW